MQCDYGQAVLFGMDYGFFDTYFFWASTGFTMEIGERLANQLRDGRSAMSGGFLSTS